MSIVGLDEHDGRSVPDLDRIFPGSADEDEIARLEAERAELELARRQERDASMIRQGRRIGGTAGAMMAGAMIALRDIYEGKVTEDDPPEIREHPGEPHDVDRDGVAMTVDGIDVAAPALPRTAPILAKQPRRRFRRRR